MEIAKATKNPEIMDCSVTDLHTYCIGREQQQKELLSECVQYLPDKLRNRIAARTLAKQGKWDAIKKDFMVRGDPPCPLTYYVELCLSLGNKELARDAAMQIKDLDDRAAMLVNIDL